MGQTPGANIGARAAAWEAVVGTARDELARIKAEIDEIAFRLYDIQGEDRAALVASLQPAPTAAADNAELSADLDDGADSPDDAPEPDDEAAGAAPAAPPDRRALVFDLVSYALGCAFGRWDARIGRDPSLAPALADPFAPLPVCSPGMLVSVDGLPAPRDGIVSEDWLRARPDVVSLPPEGSVEQPTIAAAAYPLTVAWDGVLVDDEDHELDVVGALRAALAYVWPGTSESAPAWTDEVEREACAILGVEDLREYVRNPRLFWDQHLKRYSKSQRKAPIYWLLQSSRRSFGIWVAYHRLDADLLARVRVRIVEPKLRREQARLDDLIKQRDQAVVAGRSAAPCRREIDLQQKLVSEIVDFEEKLRRAADLGVVPDLDDGVVLNAAPLWELMPYWPVAKQYWQELQRGKYGWSSIGKHLQARGLQAPPPSSAATQSGRRGRR